MKSVKEYIESGILEAYVMGATSSEETAEVEQMMGEYYEIKEEIDGISDALENYSMAHAIAPDPTIRPFLMATLDYAERMKKGEVPSAPPILHEGSVITDFAEWLNRPDMTLPDDFRDLHARIIGYTPTVLTAIVWINELAPEEVHEHELEKFLVVEGSCDIIIDKEVHHLVPGDFLAIPLYKNHHVRVTSDIPCKVVLQRVAA